MCIGYIIVFYLLRVGYKSEIKLRNVRYLLVGVVFLDNVLECCVYVFCTKGLVIALGISGR